MGANSENNGKQELEASCSYLNEAMVVHIMDYLNYKTIYRDTSEEQQSNGMHVPSTSDTRERMKEKRSPNKPTRCHLP